MNEDNLTTIFVYGTLLKGFRNSHYLESHECLCDNAQTIEHGELLMYFDRPYVHFDEKKYPILGALYQVDSHMLAKLDELEEHPHWYQRVERKIYSHTLGKEVHAHIYEVNNVPEVAFAKSSQVGCYRTFMLDYKGDCAIDWEVIDGKLVNIKNGRS